MSTSKIAESAGIEKMVSVYNMIPNFLWSVINLTPVYIFCYQYMDLQWVCIFLAISLLTLLFPGVFFDHIHLSKTTAVYKKIGVKFINKFTQNGDLVNGLIRKRFPKYNVISGRIITHKKVLQQTYFFEKFHLLMFVFFILTTIYCLIKNEYLWALGISVTNLFYNIYPILLQQYIRIRLNSFGKKRIPVWQPVITE